MVLLGTSEERKQINMSHQGDKRIDLGVAGQRFAEKWPNVKVAHVAYFTGLGMTSGAIATRLGDQTTKETIRIMWQRWDLPGDRRIAPVVVPLSSLHRYQIARRAQQAGLDQEEWLRRVVICVAEDDLFNAVVDERFI